MAVATASALVINPPPSCPRVTRYTQAQVNVLLSPPTFLRTLTTQCRSAGSYVSEKAEEVIAPANVWYVCLALIMLCYISLSLLPLLTVVNIPRWSNVPGDWGLWLVYIVRDYHALRDRHTAALYIKKGTSFTLHQRGPSRFGWKNVSKVLFISILQFVSPIIIKNFLSNFGNLLTIILFLVGIKCI